VIKCAACNAVMVADGDKLPVVWTFEKCRECDTMNKYRPTPDTPEGITTEIMSILSTTGSEDRNVRFDGYASRDEAKIQRGLSTFLGKVKKT